MYVWNSLAVLAVVSKSAEKSKHSSWSNIKHQPTFNCIKTSWPISGCTDIHNSFQVWQIAWHHCMLLLAVVVCESARRISRSSSKQKVDKIYNWKRLSLKHAKRMQMHMNSCTVVSRCIQTYKSAFYPQVLMVAEKPSIVKIIAEHLSKGRCRTSKGISRACQTYEFITWCDALGETKCKFIQTSSVGHVFNLSFEKQKELQTIPVLHCANSKRGSTQELVLGATSFIILLKSILVNKIEADQFIKVFLFEPKSTTTTNKILPQQTKAKPRSSTTVNPQPHQEKSKSVVWLKIRPPNFHYC